MGLQELVASVEKLSDSLLVIKTTNGFYVAVEKFGQDKLRFDSFHGQGLVGPWDTCHVGRPEKNFSMEAGQALREYAQLEPHSFAEANSAIKALYDSILGPLQIEPVIKNTGYKGFIVTTLRTLAWPIAGPLAYATLWAKATTGRARHGDQYQVMGAIMAPWFLKESWKHTNQNYVAALRVANPGILTKDPSGENKVGIRDYGDFDPSHFGDRSSAQSGKTYLRIVFRDGLELSDHDIWRPHAKDLYGECKYFMEVKPGTHDRLLKLNARKEARHQQYRDIHTMLTPETIYSVCKDAGFVK